MERWPKTVIDKNLGFRDAAPPSLHSEGLAKDGLRDVENFPNGDTLSETHGGTEYDMQAFDNDMERRQRGERIVFHYKRYYDCLALILSHTVISIPQSAVLTSLLQYNSAAKLIILCHDHNFKSPPGVCENTPEQLGIFCTESKKKRNKKFWDMFGKCVLALREVRTTRALLIRLMFPSHLWEWSRGGSKAS